MPQIPKFLISFAVSTRSMAFAVAMFILSMVILLPFLGLGDVFQVSEGREGVVVQSMLRGDSLILPLRHAEIIPSKPPLFHWFSFGLAKLLGRYDQFMLRLPSAISGSLIVAFLSWWLVEIGLGAGAIFSPAVLAPALLLCTSGFVRLAADGRVDMVFCGFVLAALFIWTRAYIKLRDTDKGAKELTTRTYLIVAVLCGLSVLAKGPLGIVLPIWVIITIILFEEGYRNLTALIRKEWIIAVLIPIPWYLAAALRGQEGFIARQLIFENLARFSGGEGITLKPWYFYLERIWAHAAPISFIWAPMLVMVFYKSVQRKFQREKGKAALVQRIAIISSLSMIFLFSLSAGKRTGYLLPVLPWMSLLIAMQISAKLVALKGNNLHLFPEQSAKLHALNFLSWALVLFTSILFLVIIIFSLLVPSLFSCPGEGRVMLSVCIAAQVTYFAPWKLLIFTVLLGGGALYFLALGWRASRLDSLAIACFLWVQQVLIVGFNFGVAFKGVTHGYGSFAGEVAGQLDFEKKELPLYAIKTKKEESLDGFFFDLGRLVRLVDPSTLPSGPGYYLVRRSWYDRSPAEWKQNVRLIAEGGRLVDEPEQRLILIEKTNNIS